MTVVLIIGFIVFCLYIGKKIEAQKKDPFQKSGMDGSDHSTFPNVMFDSNLSKEQSPSSTKSATVVSILYTNSGSQLPHDRHHLLDTSLLSDVFSVIQSLIFPRN